MENMEPQGKEPSFDLKLFLSKANGGRTNAEYHTNDRIFSQGDQANHIF